jgi:hypothetical protein
MNSCCVSGIVLGDKPAQSRCYRSRSSSWRETEDILCAFSGGMDMGRKGMSGDKSSSIFWCYSALTNHIRSLLSAPWSVFGVSGLWIYVQRMRDSWRTNSLLRDEQADSRKRNAFAQDLVVRIVSIRSKVSLRTLLCHFPRKIIFISVNNTAMSTLYQHHPSENNPFTNTETKRKGRYWLSSSICQVLCCVSGSKCLHVPLFSGEQNIQAWPSPDRLGACVDNLPSLNMNIGMSETISFSYFSPLTKYLAEKGGFVLDHRLKSQSIVARIWWQLEPEIATHSTSAVREQRWTMLFNL